jgi:hypothetical protein
VSSKLHESGAPVTEQEKMDVRNQTQNGKLSFISSYSPPALDGLDWVMSIYMVRTDLYSYFLIYVFKY